MSPRRIIPALIILLAVFCGQARAQDVPEKQALKQRLEREIAILDKQIRLNTSKNADALSRLSLLQTKIAARESLVAESNKEIAALEDSLSAKQKEIDIRQERLDTMSAYCERLARSAYKNRDSRIWYMYILSSDNVAQGLRRISFFKNLSSGLSTEAAKIKAEKEALETQKKELETLASKARNLKASRVRELESLRKEEKEAKNLSASLKRQKSKYQKDLAAKKRQSEALEREIRSAIKSAMGKSGSNKSKGQKAKAKLIDYKLSENFVANKGKLPWPAQGALTGRFGKQFHSVFKNLQLPANNGINIAVSPDEPVKAVFDGVVAQISVLPGYHQCILVQHGDHFTLYSKMKQVSVKSGEKVKTGQTLGTVDNIGGETVLHFEIWDNNTIPQNPEKWLRPR